MTENENILVAVYGTLKKGQRLYDAYLPGKEPEGTIWLKDHVLFHLGEFPAAAPFEGHDVFCEVFKISPTTLKYLDRVEGVETGFYNRGTFDSPLGLVHFYYQDYEQFESQAGKGEVCQHIPNGIWLGRDTYKRMWLGAKFEHPHSAQPAASRRLALRYPDAQLDAHIWNILNKSTRHGMVEPSYVPYNTVSYTPPPAPPAQTTYDLGAVIGPGIEEAP